LQSAADEKALGPEHPDTAISLDNLASLLRNPGELVDARATLLQEQGDLASARTLYERALAIREKVLGPQHPATATSLNNLALLLQEQGDLAGARELYERALSIYENALGRDNEFGPEHPDTNLTRANLASVRLAQGAPSEALVLSEAALAAHDKVLGVDHPWTKASAGVNANAFDALRRADEAAALRARYGLGAGSAT
jgi:tetratricopeptide (TPR) repeat protein